MTRRGRRPAPRGVPMSSLRLDIEPAARYADEPRPETARPLDTSWMDREHLCPIQPGDFLPAKEAS